MGAEEGIEVDMTAEEQIFAYKELRNNGQAFFVTTYEDADRIIETLEKQIPIELEKQGFFKVCKCGCEMSTFLMHNRANYCPNCGQAIKWE